MLRRKLIAGLSAIVIGAFATAALTIPVFAEPAPEELVVSGGERGVDYTYEDGVVTITKGGSYEISMASGVSQTSNSIVIDKTSDVTDLTLTLKDVTISTDSGNCILIKYSNDSEEWTFNLKLEGTNSLSSPNQAINNTRNLSNTTIEGSGSLTLTASGSPQSYNNFNNQNLTINSGTLTLNNSTLMSTNGIYVNGGTVKVTSVTDSVYATNEYVQTGGTVTLEDTGETCLHVPGKRGTTGGGITISGGDISMTCNSTGYGAISAGTFSQKDVKLTTPGTVHIESSYIGILLRNNSNLTIDNGTVQISGPLLGIWPYSDSASSVIEVNGGETEITSSVAAIRLSSATEKDIDFGESYVHKNYEGDAAASRTEVADDPLINDIGNSKKYVLITPAWPITYDLGEGALPEGESNPELYSRVDSFTLVNPVPVSDEYEFIGWTGTDLEEPSTEVTVAEGSTGERSYTATYKSLYATITYELDGGSFDGSTDPIVERHAIGETISIHEAPTKEGYTFKYWEGSEFYPGDEYTVTEDHTFTAVWEADEPSDDPSGSGGASGKNSPTGKTRLGRTADFIGLVVLPLCILMLVCMVVFYMTRPRGAHSMSRKGNRRA